MNKIFTLCILIVLLLSGCAKQNFYFFKTATASNTYQNKIAIENIQDNTEASRAGIELVAVDTLNNTGLAQISELKNTAEAKAIAHYLTIPHKAEIKKVIVPKESFGLKHILKKKLYKQALADEKPANKKGKAGFILSLVGLGLIMGGLLFAPLATIGFFVSVASIIFSAIGLSEINKDTDKYGNRTQAKLGLIISIATVAVTLLFSLLVILLLLVFFSSYSGL